MFPVHISRQSDVYKASSTQAFSLRGAVKDKDQRIRSKRLSLADGFTKTSRGTLRRKLPTRHMCIIISRSARFGHACILIF